MLPPEGTQVATLRLGRTTDDVDSGAGVEANGDLPCPPPGWDLRPRPKRLPILINCPAAGRSRYVVPTATSANDDSPVAAVDLLRPILCEG